MVIQYAATHYLGVGADTVGVIETVAASDGKSVKERWTTAAGGWTVDREHKLIIPLHKLAVSCPQVIQQGTDTSP